MTTNTSIPSLHNTVHHFVVTTTSTGITVTMDGTQVLNYATSLPPSVLVGFTGGTGGFNDVHQVQNVSITTGAATSGTHRHRREPDLGAEHRRDHGHHHRHQLHGATAVDFGPSNPATAFTVTSSTSITATAPPGHRHRRRHRDHRRGHERHQHRRPVHLRPAACRPRSPA